MIRFVRETIYRILRPRHWLKLQPVCYDLSDKIEQAVLAGDFKVIDGYTAKVGGAEIWVKNYPYSYGNLREYEDALPCSRVSDLLHKALKQEILSKEFDQNLERDGGTVLILTPNT